MLIQLTVAHVTMASGYSLRVLIMSEGHSRRMKLFGIVSIVGFKADLAKRCCFLFTYERGKICWDMTPHFTRQAMLVVRGGCINVRSVIISLNKMVLDHMPLLTSFTWSGSCGPSGRFEKRSSRKCQTGSTSRVSGR